MSDDGAERPARVPALDPEVLALKANAELALRLQETMALPQRQIAEVLASIARAPVLQMMDGIRSTFAGVLAPVENAMAALSTNYLTRVAESVRRLGTFMPDLRIEPFSASFLAYLRDLRPLEWRAAGELTARGWWLVPSWSSDFALKLLAERERKGCAIAPLLVARYRTGNCRALARLVHSWTLAEFSVGRRKSLFADALRHYRRSEFRAVILSIAPQLEGVLKDFIVAEGLATPTVIGRMRTDELFAAYIRSEREPSIRGFATQLEILYAQFAWAAPAPGTRLRRHPQAHGREVPRNSEREALRMWLLLETLHFHLANVRRARVAGAA